MPQFLVSLEPGAAVGERLCLDAGESRHLAQVTRARPGDRVTLFDGFGNRWQGRFAALEDGRAQIDALVPVDAAESPLQMELGVALLKKERWEWLLEKGTELGAAGFQPLVATRCVVRVPPQRQHKMRERWADQVLAAAKQCGRGKLPPVRPAEPLEQWLHSLPPCAPAERRLVLVPGASSGPLLPPVGVERVRLAVGPEGGWSRAEEDLFCASGWQPWALGPRTLRAETAAIAALALLQARLGDLEARN